MPGDPARRRLAAAFSRALGEQGRHAGGAAASAASEGGMRGPPFVSRETVPNLELTPTVSPAITDPTGGDFGFEAPYGALTWGAIPPFDFDNVTLRIFPLRASLERLQRFVDSYLNFIPQEAGYFRPFLPYVYLLVINYGRMSIDAENLGWVSQREVAFSVPLEWYRKEGGRLVFKDWAYVSPFIYVDNELSMKTGREVYGWPKAIAWTERELSSWMEESPIAPERLARIKMDLFPRLYAGLRSEPLPLVDVESTAPQSQPRLPPDLSASYLPWVSLPNMLRSSASLMRDYLEILRGLGLTHRTPGAKPESYLQMLKQLGRSFNPYNPDLFFNTINLKQFRDAAQPQLACYQSVTNARMSVRRIHGGGPLGSARVLEGDSTGGYLIRIYDHPLQPIVGSLGLEVAETVEFEGTRACTLRPVFPYWLDVDMRYGLGDTLAWRTVETPHWRIPTPQSQEGKLTTASAGEGEPQPQPPPQPPPETDPHYKTLGGGAGQEIAGPYIFPNTTLRVLPLLAVREKLQAFCDDWFNTPLAGRGIYLEPWGDHVFLIATSYEEMASPTNNVGWWAERELGFFVPVKEYDGEPGVEGRRLRGVALAPAFAYADSTVAATTRAEVSGFPIEQAELESPPVTWMDDAGPSEATLRHLLRLRTLLLPSLGEGQRAEKRLLVEVQEGEVIPYNDDVTERLVSERWGEQLRREVDARLQSPQSDSALLLPLELLARGSPCKLLTLKQFRDISNPMQACYQALIETRQLIDKVYDLREIEAPLHVLVHQYPSQPIVDTLGLVSKEVNCSGSSMVHVLQAVRPFWMKVSMRMDTGRTLLLRAGDEPWHPGNTGGLERACYLDEHVNIQRASRGLLEELDQSPPQRLHFKVQRWYENHPDAVPLSAGEARKALETTTPHAILGAVLSREWEHWGNPRWYQAKARLEEMLSHLESERQLLPEDKAWLFLHLGESRKQPTDPSSEVELFQLFREIITSKTRRPELVASVAEVFKHLESPSQGGKRQGKAQQPVPSLEKISTDLLRVVRSMRAMSDDSRPEGRRDENDWRKQIFWRFCQGHQKPDQCIPGAVLGNNWERERDFWLSEDGRTRWYVGPPLQPLQQGL